MACIRVTSIWFVRPKLGPPSLGYPCFFLVVPAIWSQRPLVSRPDLFFYSSALHANGAPHIRYLVSLLLSFDINVQDHSCFIPCGSPRFSHCQATLLAIRDVHKKLYLGIRESQSRTMMALALGAAGLKDGGCLTLFGGA